MRSFSARRYASRFVALRPSALPDRGHDDLVHVRTQRLVQPRALESLFEGQNLPARNHADGLDQGLAVGLDREVLQPLPGLRDHRQRAARSVNVHPDGSFHRCLLSLGVIDFPNSRIPDGLGRHHLPLPHQAHGSPCRRHPLMMLIPVVSSEGVRRLLDPRALARLPGRVNRAVVGFEPQLRNTAPARSSSSASIVFCSVLRSQITVASAPAFATSARSWLLRNNPAGENMAI